ncbi:MAG: magnesium-translocating P-type ATPase [Erysipelotrichaceae bacterium]
MNRNRNLNQKIKEIQNKEKERLLNASLVSDERIYPQYHTSNHGIDSESILHENKEEYGVNVITKYATPSIIKRIMKAFINPFTIILIVLALVSYISDVVMAPKGEENPITVFIIIIMVLISGLLRFIQEAKSNHAAEKLSEMVETTTCVERNHQLMEIPLDEVVVGDMIHLSAGDLIPADVRIVFAKDLFISQSSLSGESEPIEKNAEICSQEKNISDQSNLAFMGSNVISGSGKAIVIVVGDHTLFGQIASKLNEKEQPTSFEYGVNDVSFVLIRFMLIMVPIVFFVNGLTKGDWLDAFLFAISIAVGLTPEMLPMIVSSCLSKGAMSLAKKKTIVKKVNSIQNLGAMDILCTDKTGTLTQDCVVLEYHLDVSGNSDARVLRHAFLNSYYQTGLKNLMDKSIIEKTFEYSVKEPVLKDIDQLFTKVDEIPFDFQRKRMSVVVKDKAGKTQMISKGAIEEIISICSNVEYHGKVMKLTKEIIAEIMKTVGNYNEQGMRVIGVAQKSNPHDVETFSVEDEADMVLMGYLTFLDPPKASTKKAIQSLFSYGVDVKILTGDNAIVTKAIATQVGLSSSNILQGSDIELMSDEELSKKVESTHVFAKLSPDQKSRIVKQIRDNGHVVGYMGDGINDAPALKVSDVGISVDTAVDIAKEAADIILLEKDLNVLKDGIIEGRKTYANMIKYIKMTASSNFGNMFSVLIASAMLPFLPMMPIQLILLNLIYDLSCVAIPWDHVDEEFIKEPKAWNAKSVGKFMIWIGPTSSVFDIMTYLIMFFVICPQVFHGSYATLDASSQLGFMMLFQTGWFIESMWSQTLVIHMIRSEKIPFLQSRASAPLTCMTCLGIIVLTMIPYSPMAGYFNLIAPPLIYFAYLFVIIVLYISLATLMKKLYIKKYGELL